MIPLWLHNFSIAYVAFGAACAIVIAVDEVRHPQHMGIMNVVWPVTALFGSVLWLAGYLAWGRAPEKRGGHDEADAPAASPAAKSMPVMVAKASSHCGAGCTLGDIVAEWLVFFIPGIAVAFGWHSLFGEKIFAVWVLDYIVAFLLGIVFQYFTIKPMRGLSVKEGIVQALKADAASITAWQVGMYGFMAIAQFAWFGRLYGGLAEVEQPEFWFAMQIAMLCGFATSYPVNWLLIRMGIKEKM